MSTNRSMLYLNIQQLVFYCLHGSLPILSPVLAHARQLSKKIILTRMLTSCAIVLAVLVTVGMRILDLGIPGQGVEGPIEPLAQLILGICLLVFVADYFARIWVATEAHLDTSDDQTELKADIASHHYRLEYASSFLGVVDLLSIASLAYALISSDFITWPSFVIVLALFKLGRYIPGLDLVGCVIKNERQTLSAMLLTLGILVVVLATALYLIENPGQPEMFKSIPHSMWWGIVTMTTVGYGDMAPISWLGRIIGATAMLIGIGISHLELFAGLESGCIADIANCLKTQIVPARSAVVKKNAIADSMFFIVDGEVEVELKPKPPQPVRLRSGEIFGEAGLLDNKRRNATIRTLKTTRFLVLELRDFHRIANEHPELMDRIRAIDQERKS